MWMCGFQTAEDGREGEACHGTAEEENGERGTKNDEEGAKDSSEAFLTFLGSTGHLQNTKDPPPVSVLIFIPSSTCHVFSTSSALSFRIHLTCPEFY